MAKITVNGTPQELDKPLTLAELLVQNNVSQPGMVSIQLNGEFVLPENYDTVLNDGDEVDFLYFMGGGSQLIKNYE